MRTGSVVLVISFLVFGGAARAATRADPMTPANITVEQVKTALAGDKNLSGMDFSKANLSDANLHGAKLAHANFTKANLSGAVLDLADIIGANFTDANLTDASLDGPTMAHGLEVQKGEIPVFKGANLSNARVLARFTGGQLQGAKFAGADAGAHMANQSMGLMHTDMSSADLEGANFSGTKLGHADFSFADLRDVNFQGADLMRAVLTGADLRGANFAGANLDGAEMDDAKTAGAKGLDQARNLDKARGYKKPE